MNARERRAIEGELVGPLSGLDFNASALHVQSAHNELVTLDTRQKLVELAVRTERFQHELEGAAARQSKTLRFFGTHAVPRRCRLVLHQFFCPNTRNHVVFDAAAGYRTDDHAVIAN